MGNTDQSDESFNKLYNAIHCLLRPFGVDDALGNGDFDISADNYNGRDFYILVNNISVVRRDWVRSIQLLLQKGGNWTVHVRLGIPATLDRVEVSSPAIDITNAQCVELWDRSYLEKVFGKEFRFCENE